MARQRLLLVCMRWPIILSATVCMIIAAALRIQPRIFNSLSLSPLFGRVLSASYTPQAGMASVATASPVPPTAVLVGYITILPAKAEGFAQSLVSAKLVACVNILPSVKSIYVWKGKVEKDEEALLMIKTTAEKAPAVIDFVQKNHGYETPEVIFTPVALGNSPYLDWVKASVVEGGSSSGSSSSSTSDQ